MSQEPQPGDMIEIFRFGYQHWALYVGDGYVVHVTSADGPSSNSLASSSTKKAVVKKELLSEACEGDKWRVNNKYDGRREPNDVEEIVRQALSFVGNSFPYNVLICNCEHFATFLRYGVLKSRQAARGSGILATGILTTTGCMLTGGMLGIAGAVTLSIAAAAKIITSVLRE